MTKKPVKKHWLKFPKKIKVNNTVFHIKYDKDNYGGGLSYPDNEEEGVIEIGTGLLETNPEGVLESIIHELTEIIHIELCTRLKRPDCATAYEFHYSHKEHTTACAMLAGLLTEFIDA